MRSFNKLDIGDMVELVRPVRLKGESPIIGKVVKTHHYRQSRSWAATVQWPNCTLEHWQESLTKIPPDGNANEEL